MPRSILAPKLLTRLVESGVALALFMAALAIRGAYSVPLGDGLDGSYYYQVARHVAHGQGLTTSYSVFHMGLAPMPQPTTTYPLLPLLVGTLGRVVSLERAAVWLPGIAYAFSIALCFAFLRWQIDRSSPRPSRLTSVPMAALIAAWLAVIPVYVWTSARPYTESLGTTVTLGTLWCFGRCSGSLFRDRYRRAAGFFGVGLLAGLCYLARFQLFMVGVALIGARALARDRRALRDSVCIGLGLLPCVGWQAFRLFSHPHAELIDMIDFAAYRQLPSLPRFQYYLHFDDPVASLADKLQGLLDSFDPRSEVAYQVQLGVAALLVPVGALLLLLRQAWRARRLRWRVLRWPGLRRPRHAALLCSAFLGVLAVAPIHALHSPHWPNWAFRWRQGLPLVFVIVPVAIWLCSFRGWFGRGLVALVFAWSLYTGWQGTRLLLDRPVSPRQYQAYAQVGAYLERSAPTKGTLGIEHQALGVFTDAPLYWLACWSPPSFATTLVREIKIDRILLRRGEIGCHSLDGLRGRLQRERDFSDYFPMTLYRIGE